MELAHALLAYAIPAALITMLPEPNTAMVLTTAVKGGRRAAVMAAAGVGTGITCRAHLHSPPRPVADLAPP